MRKDSFYLRALFGKWHFSFIDGKAFAREGGEERGGN